MILQHMIFIVYSKFIFDNKTAVIITSSIVISLANYILFIN